MFTATMLTLFLLALFIDYASSRAYRFIDFTTPPPDAGAEHNPVWTLQSTQRLEWNTIRDSCEIFLAQDGVPSEDDKEPVYCMFDAEISCRQ